MTYLEQLLAIARNTFAESVRQPIVLVVAVIATILCILSNPLAAYTMDDDQRMFVDIGLSTVFIGSAIVAAFIATNVLSREIENRTVLMVVSKPVARPIFVVGKYLGVAAALVLVMAYLSFVFMLVEMHGVLQTVTTPIHQPVVVFGSLAALIGVGGATWANYFYGKNFASTYLLLATPAAGIAYALALLFGPDWSPHSAQAIFVGMPPLVLPIFKGTVWVAIGMLSIGVLILAAIALAASTKLGQVLTLGVTLGLLLLGLLSDWMFGRRILRLEGIIERTADAGGTSSLGELANLLFLKFAYAVVPNFQVFWLADAINQRKAIPLDYVLRAIPYGFLMIAACLLVAIALFQRREIG
jgi:ABC-type transport system involved in multi-copper enzyme maturation permease subunit